MFYNILGRTLLRLPLQTNQQFNPKISKRCFESGKKCSNPEPLLSQTFTLVQEGKQIQELPMIIQRIDNIGAFCVNKVQESGDKSKKDAANFQDSKSLEKNVQSNVVIDKGLLNLLEFEGLDDNKNRIDIETDEGKAILFTSDLEFLKNANVDQVLSNLEPPYINCGKYSVIENTISDEINCRVALQALAKIIELENYQYQQNFTFHERSLLKLENRNSVIKKLVEIISKSRDSEAIAVGLEILINDRVSPSRNVYRDRLRNETLIRVIDGDFSIIQLIDVVRTFSVCRDPTYRKAIDLLWIGFKIRERDINSTNIVTLFKILHFFKESKVMVSTILTNKLQLIYPKLSGTQMADILDVFHHNIFSSPNSFADVKNITTQWMINYSENAKDRDLSEILGSLKDLNFVNETVVHALEKIVKDKGTNIKDPALVSAIMKYCMKVRVESSSILDFGAEYFISQGKDLPEHLLPSIFAPFGFFSNSSAKIESVFEVITKLLNSKFSKLDPQNTLDILLTCIYAKKYPEDLIDEKFQMRMRRVLKKKKNKSTKSLRKKLLIFDSVMALESENYGNRKFGWIDKEKPNPFLPNLRIRQMINKIKIQLSSLVGGAERLGIGMILGGLPVIDFYNIDILVYPSSIQSPIVNLKSDKIKKCRAILIHLPEHRCFGTKTLIGPQMMRIRILRKLGFQVATLDYEILSKMKKYSIEMTNYLAKQIATANRVIKSPQEIEVMRYVVKISSDAHKALMRKVRPGLMEYQAEAAFINHAYSIGGCRHMGYICICGSGHNASILHYGHAGAPNNKLIVDGDMCLFDMGAIYCGYTADITCSFPANGVFTPDQKLIYNAVLNARNAVIEAAKPGVFWTDMHLLANRAMLEAMKKGGLLVGKVDDMISAGLNEVFQPHGLGHLLGLDVHDVGGYLPGHPGRPTLPSVRRLRTARKLQAGMILTIEPGCYFIDSQLKSAFSNKEQAKFLVADEIYKFRNFGGIRIEDDVLITEIGVENLTQVPRTVEEIEKWMSVDREKIRLPQDEKLE